MDQAEQPTVVSREPWWNKPPAPGQDEMTCDWVYLELWSDGTFSVDHMRPADDEIRARKSCRSESDLKLL